jgi:hypothetical protein
MNHLRSLGLVCLPLTLACGDSKSDPQPEDDTSTSAGDAATSTGGAEGTGDSTGEPQVVGPTYYGDVLPVFIEQCNGCHTEGGIGPFDLSDYETARSLAELISIVTEGRTMPPFNANNEGICNTFEAARWLDDDQIALLREWADTGAQEGDPTTMQPDPPPLSALAGADIVEYPMPEGYVPVADLSSESGVDDYQCFKVDLGITDAPRYLTGYEVAPGNEAVTHHLVGFLVEEEGPSLFGTNADLIAQLDAASPDQPGWDCFGAAGNGVNVEGTPVTWAPGGGAFNFPEGTGIRVDPGYVLVAQMHYNLINEVTPDSTVLRLSWADSVEREAVNALQDKFLAAGFNGTAEIPAGEEAFTWQWDEQVRDFSGRMSQWKQIEILGVLPHMHSQGTRMQVNFFTGPDNTEQCGLFVDRWNYQWQQAFMYETPFILDPTDTIQVTCEWNTVGNQAPTLPGLGTQSEMCLLGLYAAEVK